ncbi:Bug family tripartite tricarboxylate transporter substrate binding protein [Paracandidimonas soli]|uniref:Tripartite-type tricarboxylate transporter receptor subunit TctC n=1 Tax=Paracandidimonas soli TaxID=1917182 RepID=A0A4R3VCR2_9BURK|nr:tripartite tricarboxylate transporter substrate binding protein [Paracandidimonas soli]TCV03117.1 tripartite-type tricarboxylate transporter receptor subunit TctC [Paracandidimonas soli]
MTMTRRTVLLGTATGALSFAARGVFASNFPQQPIRIIVPYAPGGITDILSRLIADKMSDSLPGARVIVDNRPGAAGLLGTNQVAKATPDGYTILMGSIAPLVIAKIAAKDLSYDPFTDFVPITQIASAPLILAVNPAMPVSNAPDLIDLLKKNPGKYNYSSAGAGAPSHLAYELFRKRYDVDMAHIPYKGTGASLVDLVAGEVQLTMDSAAGLLPFIKSGRLKPLGVAAKTRSPLMPDVPSLEEQGLGEFDVSGWYGYLAPTGTPATIIETLSDAINKTVALPEVTQQITELGAIANATSPQAFKQLLQDEYTRWRPIVEELGLKFG